MAFHEVRLPVRLAFGSTGGVKRRTEIVSLASGFERRASPWAHGRRRYLIGAGVRGLEDAAELAAFFEARRGRLHGFRFKDFLDFRSAGVVTPLDQLLGTGNGAATEFQLVKWYGEGDTTYDRPITKPVAGAVRVAVAGLELDVDGFAVDTATGLVTLANPPPEGAAVTAGFEFDVPVRFDSDRLDVTLEGFDAGRVVAVPLVEVRV
ncbi:MAG: phage distal tail protein, Rcc01695 family [Caulobacteraceae bacterium]